MLPLVANNTILILRPKPEVNVDGDFLTAYHSQTTLFMPCEHKVLPSGYTPNRWLKYPFLFKMRKYELSYTICSGADPKRMAGEADAALRSLFDFESARDARAHLLRQGGACASGKRAARQIDDLSYRLRIGLPHPLAYRWRLAETAQPTLEGYRDVLECAEIGACYLALIVLVMMREVGEPVGHLAEMADRLTNRGHGDELWDWVTILREARDKNVCAK